MATVILQYAGAAIGTFLGGPIGGMIGRAVGAVAGNIFDQALFGPGTRKIEGPRLTDLRVMGSSEGSPIPRVWGRMRVAGQVVWATHLEEVVTTDTEDGSSKGGGQQTKTTTYEYFANFAVALCEGEIDRIGRAWADGKDFDMSGLTARVHRGSETQEPDSLIAAKEGAGNAPAYRGLAYVVFERLPLANFGNRIPQLSFEVFRAAGGAEDHVRAVALIPGSTEFGYDTTVVTRDLGGGETESENAHASASVSDWTVSLDDLTAGCRNLEAASLVVAWFGDDLRCGDIAIRPGVETVTKVTSPGQWSVSGVTRVAAHLVSTVDGRPAFGGTPSDASVVRALQDLGSRGLATVFYPFILMDVPADNTLPDPYGGTSQAPYPWRGRITCDPAPGQPGSPDKTAACATQLAGFIGTAQPTDFNVSGAVVTYSGPAEWSYRRMVLHYAKLCAAAGGVDAFLIGSELRGLTSLRSSASVYPFVSALVTLAAEVKAILPVAKVSYAADWSEYFGHQPQDGSGDVFFNLDSLWASANVDFVGIDNYMPLTDWRDGVQHTDRSAYGSIYDPAYIAARIAGGEGFDWYYASAAARDAQTRTAITDGAYGKPWVFRYKDLKSWWLNQHFNRPGGVESASPTGWAPQSKPLWFTEAGCAAIDKGTNQPNVFIDAKSSESLLPYYSTGHRDDFIQNRFVVALSDYWSQGPSVNPISSVYGGPMLDPARVFLWAWDARPFPYFPARTDIWADGINHARGHWLNGRIGAVPIGELIARVCEDYGFTDYDAGEVQGLIDGFVIDRVMSARAALEALLSAFAVDAVESGGKLRFRMRKTDVVAAIAGGALVETGADAALFALNRAQETELPGALKLAYVESGLDYRVAAVESRRLRGSSAREMGLELSCAVGQAVAQMRADILLQESWAGRDSLDFALPPSRIELEPGDVVNLELPSGSREFRLEQASDGAFRKLRSRNYEAQIFEPPDAPDRSLSASLAPVYGKPDVAFLDLPLAVAGSQPHAFWLAASAKPWPGRLSVLKQVAPASYQLNRTIDAQATKGVLLEALPAGPLFVFDRSTAFTVRMQAGALVSITEAELLLGGNAAAVGDAASGWEIIQFANAQLIAAKTYRVSMLLRGQSGSNNELLASRAPGSRFVLLNKAVVQPVLPLAEAALALTWKIGPSRLDAATSAYMQVTHQGKMLGLRPLSPCQLRGRRDGGDAVFSWIRRTRIDGDSWEAAEVPLGEDGESYALDILDGATVKRTASLATPAYRYAASDIASDFGAMPDQFTLRVAQMSTVFGRGATLQRTIHV